MGILMSSKRNGEWCVFVVARCTTQQILRFYETENFVLLAVNKPNNLGCFEDIGFWGGGGEILRLQFLPRFGAVGL